MFSKARLSPERLEIGIQSGKDARLNVTGAKFSQEWWERLHVHHAARQRQVTKEQRLQTVYLCARQRIFACLK
jgi:hypothetical protein